LPSNKPIQPTAPAVAFLDASDFEDCFLDLSVSFSQGQRLMGRALGRNINVVQMKLRLVSLGSDLHP